MPVYVPYVLYKHVKIVSYNSNTTSKQALGFKSSNQLNKAGREFMNIQFGFQNSCLIWLLKKLPIFYSLYANIQ